MNEIYQILGEIRQRPGEEFALATLVRAQGSSYRRPGARMLVCANGDWVGSLSAGCLEQEVASRALEILRTGQPGTMTFDTRKRFGCAGQIDIFIEPAPKNVLLSLATNIESRITCFATTRFSGGQLGTRIGTRDGKQDHEHEFVQEIHPPLRLFIFGVGPDTASLHFLARSLGWQTFDVVDLNALFVKPDLWTAAIVNSHHYGRDFAALQQVLPLNLPYVGLIGPRNRRNQLLGDLLELGVTINAGFFAPAGLDLGAETPEEIALEIVAEIQRVFAEGSGLSLRDKKTPIHAGQVESFQAKSRIPADERDGSATGSFESGSLR